MEKVGHAREEERDNSTTQPPGAHEGYAAWVPYTNTNGSPSSTVIDKDPVAYVSTEELPGPPLTTRPARSTGTKPAGSLGLPLVAPGADLARVRVPWYWMAFCFTVTFLVYLSLVPNFLRFSNPPTGDQVYYMMDTISLVEDHDLLLNNNYQNRAWERFYSQAPHPYGFVGMIGPNPLPPMNANATARPPEEMYSYHLPGLAAWMVPAWVVGGFFQLWWPACIVFMGLIGSLAALNIFLFAHELTGKPWIAWAVWAAVAFSSPLMTYSYLIFTELPIGLLLIYAFRRLALGWNANGPFRLFLVGLAIGNIPWVAWRCVPIAVCLGLYALVQWWRYRRVRSAAIKQEPASEAQVPVRNNGSFGRLALLVAPAVVLGGLLVYYNLYLFGRIIPDGSMLEQGRIAIFHYPWQSVSDARAFVSAIFGQLFDRGFGLLPYSPVYVLAFVGIIAGFRLGGPYKRLLLWMGLLSLPYLLVICSFDNWNGVWCPPARYLTTFVPFMSGLLAVSLFALQRSTVYKVLYALLSIPGWVLISMMMSDARLFWPIKQGGAFDKLKDLSIWPIKTDLSQFLPSFSPIDDLAHPGNTGWITVAAMLAVISGYLLMQWQGRRRDAQMKRIPYPAQGAVWAVTLLAVASGWLFINYDYIKHRTDFTQVNRWYIPVMLDEPYGITYDDGKVYLSSYARNTLGIVGAFDLASQHYVTIQPISGTATTQFSHVGDIKVGPDGNLYVLNNGEAGNAMWVMKPDGHIMLGLELQSKTPIATGLNFGPDGNMYVSDMLGGRIIKYPPQGGAPLGIYKGMTSGFNNPSGVAVTPDGTIYAAEQGFKRLQVLAGDGTFMRNIDLGCKPTHVTVSGDFLDVSCEGGLISVNWKKNELQLAHYDSLDHKPTNPTGLTYGPNNELFVLDHNALIEYKVEH